MAGSERVRLHRGRAGWMLTLTVATRSSVICKIKVSNEWQLNLPIKRVFNCQAVIYGFGEQTDVGLLETSVRETLWSFLWSKNLRSVLKLED